MSVEKPFEYVQYIVMRKDLIPKMGIGKACAQAAHAAIAAITEDGKLINNEVIPIWLEGSYTKFTVYVKTKVKLLNLSNRLTRDGIKNNLIWDTCRTQLEPEEEDGTILTCMGVVPMHRDNVPRYLGKLMFLS